MKALVSVADRGLSRSRVSPSQLACFTTRATNGRTEGTNRILKHIKRLGFGYTNTENYRLRILYRCRPLPSAPPARARPAA
jgi:hypothetical protein